MSSISNTDKSRMHRYHDSTSSNQDTLPSLCSSISTTSSSLQSFKPYPGQNHSRTSSLETQAISTMKTSQSAQSPTCQHLQTNHDRILSQNGIRSGPHGASDHQYPYASSISKNVDAPNQQPKQQRLWDESQLALELAEDDLIDITKKKKRHPPQRLMRYILHSTSLFSAPDDHTPLQYRISTSSLPLKNDPLLSKPPTGKWLGRSIEKMKKLITQ
ncbi:uncharacterized protein BYT42DRAFT_614271 [Radiomyces spectabilis]|uniref:uncharacterized protein n=1 Tax=Radiomyces spectabilis TaxID=64574 RepID=UPI00221EEA5F|nr:uncharacterized protein BYT42DRAFT_614271 [Radiomyces spectabilis]KAI8377601.1 hypothetical protein BYT42DRAFT_614271 [Radiomyces spectabilis]